MSTAPAPRPTRARSLRASSAAVLAAALLTTAACGSDGATRTAASGAAPGSAAPAASATDPGCPQARGRTVGYSEPLPSPNFVNTEKIMKSQLDRYGVALRVTNAGLNTGKQLADIRTLLQGGIDVLVVNPLAPQAIRPALDEARAKKVPIVAQESQQGGPFLTNVTVDAEAAAAEAVAAMKAAGGKVAAVTAPPLAELLVRENTAFTKDAKAAGLDVVDIQALTTIAPQPAKVVADGLRQRYGADLKAVWTFNDTAAVGIASSFGDGFRPQLYSINGAPEAIPLVADGRITATWELHQDKVAQALVASALAALCGRSVPSEIVVPVTRIDRSTVASYRPLAARVGDPFDVRFTQRDGRTYLVVGP